MMHVQHLKLFRIKLLKGAKTSLVNLELELMIRGCKCEKLFGDQNQHNECQKMWLLCK